MKGPTVKHFILDGKNAIPTDDVLEWASGFESEDRRVAFDKVDDVEISTVFLGLNHQWGDGPPLIFETMVFGGPLDQDCERYSTWEQAEAGHSAMIDKVKAAQKGED